MVVPLLGVLVWLALVGVRLPFQTLGELRTLVDVDLHAPLAVRVEEHGVDRVDTVLHAGVLRIDHDGEAGLLEQGQVRFASVLAAGVLSAGVWIHGNAVTRETRLDLLDHLRRVTHRVELVQGQGQAISDDVDHRRHLHDVEVHADVQSFAWLDALAGAARGAVEGVVHHAGVVLEPGLVFLAERAGVHLAPGRVQLIGRDVAALQ
ncbi:hypothetical protein D3C76_1189990 [compost metagenome]